MRPASQALATVLQVCLRQERNRQTTRAMINHRGPRPRPINCCSPVIPPDLEQHDPLDEEGHADAGHPGGSLRGGHGPQVVACGEAR